MRLFSTKKVEFIDVYGAAIPPYAILSHTWSTGEILLNDLLDPEVFGKPWSALIENPPKALAGPKQKGFDKILGSIDLARKSKYDYVWVDTCCIDKTSSAELSEAINSMYRWYAGAEVCYAYLADVPPATIESPLEPNSKFRRSRWFTRGWTLQELIASKQVQIFASDWSYLGSKDGEFSRWVTRGWGLQELVPFEQDETSTSHWSSLDSTVGNIAFTKLLCVITGVQLDVLLGKISPQDMSIAARMHWAAGRQTTRAEDIAYCLLGIFEVTMPLLYGEGEQAFIRLQEAILSKEEDQSLFAWHSEKTSPGPVNDPLLSAGYSGLLADSPDRFSEGNDMETAMPLTVESNPLAVTSKGLRVEFLLLPCSPEQPVEEADFRVVLNCERLREGQRDSPVIYLKRIWGMGQQFTRVRSDLKSFIPPNINFLDEGQHETVFVKQDPRSDMRTIRVEPAGDTSQLHIPGGLGDHRMAVWKIKDAWPKQGWAKKMQTFQTRDMTFGKPCGILRLSVAEAGKDITVDVAIGMHAASNQMCRSWCQILNFNSILTVESAFSWAMREATSGKIDFNSLSTQDIHGSAVSTWIVVTERNRKGRLDISLHVLSDNPPDEHLGDTHKSTEDYGDLILTYSLPAPELNCLWENNHHPLHHLPARTKLTWEAWKADVAWLMRELCVVDSIEVSVFPRVSFGTKVRIKSQTEPTMGSVESYCFNTLPSSDTETRSLVKVLCLAGDVDSRYLDAARILESRPDSFLQLNPLQWAVIGGHESIVNVLLGTGIDSLGISGRRLTTIHLGFLLSEPTVVRQICGTLYNSTYDMDTEDWATYIPTVNNDDYPLHFAAAYATHPDFWGHGDFEMLAMECAPKLNRLGERPLHRAAAMGNVSAVRWFLRAHNVEDPNYQCFRYVDVSKDANDLDFQDRTPLWHAACSDFTGTITRDLLVCGALPDLADIDGLAPIHVACRYGNFGCVKKLKANGANLNTPAGSLGLLPTHFAAIFGRKACLQVLLKYNAGVVSYSGDGSRVHALHLAIANGHERCARAIWKSLGEKASFSGWSLCIVGEETGYVLKWMYLEVTALHWYAVEDPWQGGTSDYVCFSDEDVTPKLWVRSGVTRIEEEGKRDLDVHGMDDDEEEEHKEKKEFASLNSAAVTTESLNGSMEVHAKRRRKAKQIFKSMFKG